MQLPMEIVFHDLEPSAALETLVRRHVEELEKFCNYISSCRVVIEAPHRHHHRGRIYAVRIDLTVPPRKEIVVDRTKHRNHAHEDVYVAVGDAFRAAKRKLEDHVRVVRGDVKQHEEAPHARVAYMEPEQGFGFLETSDGERIYFHEHSVRDEAFRDLQVGTEVHYTPGSGDKGPTATSVHVVRQNKKA